MQIVIDIPDSVYRVINFFTSVLDSTYEKGDDVKTILIKAVLKGTLLPKGHGDLIDRSEVIKSLFDYHKGQKTIGQCIDEVQTIIEADKAESEDKK